MKLHKWTKEQLDFINETYQSYDRNVTLKLLNEKFNLSITKGQLKSIIDKYHITCGRKTHYQNGTTPYNKGKCWNEWMPKESQENSRKTTFTKGLDAKEIGTEVITTKGYVMVKVNENLWRPKHHLIYEKANGPIPKGYRVLFIDGNNKNFNLDNLILLKHNEQTYISGNRFQFKGNNVFKTGLLMAKINSKRKELIKLAKKDNNE